MCCTDPVSSAPRLRCHWEWVGRNASLAGQGRNGLPPWSKSGLKPHQQRVSRRRPGAWEHGEALIRTAIVLLILSPCRAAKLARLRRKNDYRVWQKLQHSGDGCFRPHPIRGFVEQGRAISYITPVDLLRALARRLLLLFLQKTTSRAVSRGPHGIPHSLSPGPIYEGLQRLLASTFSCCVR
jgi:hypothetical protein